MLGYYENFPKIIHGIANFSYKASSEKVQQAIVATFYRLNQETLKLKEITHFSLTNCLVNFEFGIGEDATFTYLDKNELARLETEKKALTFLDFLCALQYHVIDSSGKRCPLKFDYYFLRFAFGENYMEFLVSHERGPQHVHVEDLIDFLTNQLKSELSDQYSVALKLESTRTV